MPDDYAVSRKEVWRIVTAGANVAIEKKDWNLAACLTAIRDMILELDEYSDGAGDERESD